MLGNYPACEQRVLAHEGSKYTDGVRPYDPGGPTRWGITLEDARLHWKPNATADDVRTMPVSVAMGIYKSKYWDAVNGDKLPSGLDDTVFDYGVNSGIGRSGKVLRRLCSLPDNTSKIDQNVLDAVAKRDVKTLIHAMNAERLRFLQSLAIWPTYKGGWTTRVHEVEDFSIQLALAGPTATVSPQTIPVTPSDGKGQIPPPVVAKNVIKGSTFGSVPLWLWLQQHPAVTILLVAASVALAVVLIRMVESQHAKKQEAPTPGLLPVPANQ